MSACRCFSFYYSISTLIKSNYMKSFIMLFIAVCTTFGTFAQKAKSSSTTKSPATVQVSYTCPMHPEVMSDKPGKCPKCNMDLSLSKKERLKMEVTNNYTCPMHTEVASDKPGKCPICKTDLKVAKSTSNSKKA